MMYYVSMNLSLFMMKLCIKALYWNMMGVKGEPIRIKSTEFFLGL